MRKLINTFAALLLAVLCSLTHTAFAQQGGGFPPPPFKFCSTTCTVTLSKGQSAILYKNVQTTRTSTAVLALDPDLNITCSNCLGISYYGQLIYFVSNGTQGFIANLSSGTCGSHAAPTYATGEITALTVSSQDVASNNFANSNTTVSAASFMFVGGSNVSASPQQIAWCWAQNVSGATNTFVNPGSYFVITRLL